jgi:hypothetical protein
VHALPLAMADINRPAGTVAAFIADDGGDEAAWYVTRTQGEWELGRAAPAESADCEVRTTTAGAIQSFVRNPAAPAFTWRGDPELARLCHRPQQSWDNDARAAARHGQEMPGTIVSAWRR